MELEINSDNPSIVRFKSGFEDKLSQIKSFLTFSNKSAIFTLRKFQNNKWIVRKMDPVDYNERLNELKAKTKVCMLMEDLNGYYSYSGLTHELITRFKATLTNDIVYPEPKLIPWAKLPPEMRYYQSEALGALLNAKHGAIEMATGGGKSLVILNLVKSLGLKTLIVSPTESIARQLLFDFEMYFGRSKVGFFGAGTKKSDKLITISIDESLTKIEKGSEAYKDLSKAEVLITDECFTYDTSVMTEDGTKLIGSLVSRFKKGQSVPKILSFNEKTKIFEYKNMLNGFKKPLKELIKVRFDNKTITCTAEHKFLTKTGWKKAEELVFGDLVLGKIDLSSKRSSGSVIFNDDQNQVVMGSILGDGSITKHVNKYRMSVIHGAQQKEYLEFKASMFQREKKIGFIEKNGYAQKPAYRFATKLFCSDLVLENRKKSIDQSLIDRIDWRGIAIWFQDDGGNNRNIGATLHTESFSEECVLRLIKKMNLLGIECKLQKAKKKDGRIFNIIKINKVGFENLSKKIAPYILPSMSYKLLPLDRILAGSYKWDNKISDIGEFFFVKSEKDIDLAYLKSRPYLNGLYDLEIEDNHNYVVGGQGRQHPDARRQSRESSGVIVHNCHLVAAESLAKISLGLCSTAKYRFYVSATQMRNDGADTLLKGITGKIVYYKTLKELVDEGFLARPVFKMVEVESDSNSQSSDILSMIRTHQLHNGQVYDFVGKAVNKAVEMGQKCLILIDQVDQIPFIQPLMKYDTRYAFSGQASKVMPKGFVKEAPNDLVNQFNDGKFPVLVGTSTIGLGSNTKPVDNLFLILGGKSPVKFLQAVGRGSRLVPGKTTFKVFDFKITDVEAIAAHADARKVLYNSLGVGQVERIEYY